MSSLLFLLIVSGADALYTSAGARQVRRTEFSTSTAWLAINLAYTSDSQLGRVENRRSGFSLPVACGLGFRFAASIRFGLALFPVPAHRTGQAELPHPALGKDSR